MLSLTWYFAVRACSAMMTTPKGTSSATEAQRPAEK